MDRFYPYDSDIYRNEDFLKIIDRHMVPNTPTPPQPSLQQLCRDAVSQVATGRQPSKPVMQTLLSTPNKPSTSAIATGGILNALGKQDMWFWEEEITEPDKSDFSTVLKAMEHLPDAWI